MRLILAQNDVITRIENRKRFVRGQRRFLCGLVLVILALLGISFTLTWHLIDVIFSPTEVRYIATNGPKYEPTPKPIPPAPKTAAEIAAAREKAEYIILDRITE